MNGAERPKLVNLPGNGERGVEGSPDAILLDKDEYNPEDWRREADSRRRQLTAEKAEREKHLNRLKKIGAATLGVLAAAGILWLSSARDSRMLEADLARQRQIEDDEEERARCSEIANAISDVFRDAEYISIDGDNVIFRVDGESGSTVIYSYDGVNLGESSIPTVTSGEAVSTELDEKGIPKEGGIVAKSEGKKEIDAMRRDLDRQLNSPEVAEP